MTRESTIQQLTDRALALHARNFNCAQCVACTLAPLVEASEDASFRMMEGFGSGMGCRTETCGAVAGAVAMLGMANSFGPANPTSKAQTYELAAECVARFREKNGTTTCRTLRGTDEPGPLPACNGYIADAVRIGAEILFDRQEQAAR